MNTGELKKQKAIDKLQVNLEFQKDRFLKKTYQKFAG